MSEQFIPGTVLSYDGVDGGMLAAFRPMLAATDGLSLGQICAITGLEPAVIQNWVKRGFVPHPVCKKYGSRHLARILLIVSMRDCMRIEQVGELLRLVNGDADDESDDIVSEERLYDYLCEIIRRTDGVPSEQEATRRIAEIIADYRAPDEGAYRRLSQALQVMLYAYTAGQLKQQAERLYSQMSENN